MSRTVDREAIVTAAISWRDARRASVAATTEKRVAGLAYRAEPRPVATGALTRYVDATQAVKAARQRERSALLALSKACNPSTTTNT